MRIPMIRVYDTLTRSKVDFHVEGGVVKMYVCGPTVYNFIHIGNARAYVAFDVIRRYLEYRGYRVKYVQNITDVDDKIIRRAFEEGTTPEAIAARYTEEYLRDVRALDIIPPTVQPLATEHVGDMIEIIKDLISKGLAYVSEGNVYFDITKAKDYGQLSGLSADELMAGARVEIDERKRNPLDFALWKASEEGPTWDSPWGTGRPGWHIECSTMALKYLGPTLDVHGGGQDLIFPHHENEIQQAEGHTGVRFCRYWLHNGFLTIRQEKMSKSLGNITTVREILTRWHPRVLRFFLLDTQYRKPVDYTEEGLKEAEKAYLRLFNAYHALRRMQRLVSVGRCHPGDGCSADQAIKAMKEAFISAMDDDFNSRSAIASVFTFVRWINANLHALSEDEIGRCIDALEDVDKVLGILDDVPYDETMLEILIEVREELRSRGAFDLSDLIRSRLSEMGIQLEDDGHMTRVEYTKLPPITI